MGSCGYTKRSILRKFQESHFCLMLFLDLFGNGKYSSKFCLKMCMFRMLVHCTVTQYFGDV